MADSKTKPEAAARPDRMQRLQTIPRLKQEAETIEVMVKCYCKAHHSVAPRGSSGLCEDCEAFLAYARKRLACCPYGAEKPVCAKCRIHCYKATEKAFARNVMRYAGPRLVFMHPLLAVKHLIDSRRPAPEKPRNTKQTEPTTPTNKDA